MIRVEWDGERLLGDTSGVGAAIARAERPCALTGAGISVESGIADFRSPDGLWSRFEPGDYATLSTFLSRPERSWELFRALGRELVDREPNPAHRALAELERADRLAGIVTQNIDGLHQAAGSGAVIEIHGSHRGLHCLRCDTSAPFDRALLDPGPVPLCTCGFALKPSVVLFDEPVRELDRIGALLAGCDLLIVAGTSVEVAPASLFPATVLNGGGSVLEFNLEPTDLTACGLGPNGAFVRGPLGKTLPLIVDAVLEWA